MRHLATAIAAALTLMACGSDPNPQPAAPGHEDLAQLTIRVDADGEKGAPAKELKLSCKAPTDSQACGEAAGVSAADLAPTPSNKACTQLFGGPQTASIRGTIRGNRVDATFSRRDGCEIERWKRVEALLGEVR